MKDKGGAYLLAEVDRWDIGLVKVIRHSKSSPARKTGPRDMEATTSIICADTRGINTVAAGFHTMLRRAYQIRR